MAMDNKKKRAKTETCHDIPDLPCDIIVDIISRLHVKFIIQCKSLSKAFKNLISEPSFASIYDAKSNSFHVVCVDNAKRDNSLDLIELDKREFCKKKGDHKISKVTIFNTKRIPGGGSSSEWRRFSHFGYCNGLFCLSISDLGLYNLFVINPVLSEFIQLPEPVVFNNIDIFFSYGIGYCQLSDRYKVLRMIAEHIRGDYYKTNSQIFTIGYDQNWRSLEANNVPCTIPSTMVPFRSALHWIVHPIYSYITLWPNWSGRIYICAFDMTEEKVNAIQLPPGVAEDCYYCQLSVLLDKLSLWRKNHFDLWVLDEYGVEGSWTKQFVLNMSNFPSDITRYTLRPLMVSPEGVTVLSDCQKLVVYDMKKEKCLRVIHRSKHVYYPIQFAPNFVSLRNLVQGPGSMIDVQSCSPVSEVPQAFPAVSEVPQAFLGDQFQMSRWTRITNALKNICSYWFT